MKSWEDLWFHIPFRAHFRRLGTRIQASFILIQYAFSLPHPCLSHNGGSYKTNGSENTYKLCWNVHQTLTIGQASPFTQHHCHGYPCIHSSTCSVSPALPWIILSFWAAVWSKCLQITLTDLFSWQWQGTMARLPHPCRSDIKSHKVTEGNFLSWISNNINSILKSMHI